MYTIYELRLILSYLFNKYNEYYPKSSFDTFDFFCHTSHLFFNLPINKEGWTMTRDIMKNSIDLWGFYSKIFDVSQVDHIFTVACENKCPSYSFCNNYNN